MTAPMPATLATDRLTLRRPAPRDADAMIAYYATPRSALNGGPQDRAAAWRSFAVALGHWDLRGYGLYSVEAAGTLIGRVGLWYPEGWPEPELGWVMYEGAEGKGYAHEAALAVRTAAYAAGWQPMLSVIAPGNDRSIRLAERLGARLERDWTAPSGRTALLYRHPGAA